MLLGSLGINIVPVAVSPFVLMFAYFCLLTLYRKKLVYGLPPLLKSLKKTLVTTPDQAGVDDLFGSVFPFIILIFPFFFSFMFLWMLSPAAINKTSSEILRIAGNSAMRAEALKSDLAMILLFSVIGGVAFFCLMSERDTKKDMPKKQRKLYLKVYLPITAVLLGESAASASDLIQERLSDAAASVTLTLAVFIPLRLLLLRTAGASKLAYYSFAAASLVAVASMVHR
jgi:hypothetical protein